MKHIKFKWLVLLKCLYPKKLPSFKSRPIIEIKRPYISGIHRILHHIFHDIFSLQFSKIYKSEKVSTIRINSAERLPRLLTSKLSVFS